ncbi:MAG: hypothetical protein GWP08_14475 [Nitrospiraceae bacterium]|nr:hypothetical protein [Nitrospiraceae bacterium]
MVTINLTLFVMLGLFLVFVWLMNTFVFRPLLALMDKRAARMDGDKQTAQTATDEAETLERKYRTAVSDMHREESVKLIAAHREAQAAHNQRVRELKAEEEAELAAVRAEAMTLIEVERQRYPELTKDLVEAMAECLDIEGNGS